MGDLMGRGSFGASPKAMARWTVRPRLSLRSVCSRGRGAGAVPPQRPEPGAGARSLLHVLDLGGPVAGQPGHLIEKIQWDLLWPLCQGQSQSFPADRRRLYSIGDRALFVVQPGSAIVGVPDHQCHQNLHQRRLNDSK